ncbi:50S ribosomal protein L25/general stress protein Ctc [Fodinicurvata sp. EGI_FJ10296]|uniref:50S ribosomal protein L25/general stress protein Ctc n=1 Tax=Fodinicurvata sp. EGI_FJ10296 TaxID=3231908 RepID=UPI0034513105
MAEAIKIDAQLRERAGKGAARQARREKKIPGVIYGNKQQPVVINVDELELFRITRDPHYATHLYDVMVNGTPHHTLIRALQVDVVTEFPIHVDFLRVSDRTSVTMNVPVAFINEDDCPGIQEGGVLNVVRHEIEVDCRADSIPDTIEIDLTGVNVGDSIHISQVKLPRGVTPNITDRDFTVATMTAPSAMKSEGADTGEETGAEVAEEAETKEE